MNLLLEHHSLLLHNTFGFSASARYWGTFASDGELGELLQQVRERGLEWYVLSGGSNVILTGKFEGAFLHPVLAPGQSGISILDQGPGGVLVRAEAGVVWDDLVSWAVEHELGGIENLTAIPGYVGAAPVQNIGAYGVEVESAIEYVEYLNTHTLELSRIAGSECQFGYRESIFKHALRGRAIVTAVILRLQPIGQGGEYAYNIGYGDLYQAVEALGGASLWNVRTAVAGIRKQKLPDPRTYGNAGSFFKNPLIPTMEFERLRAQYPDIPTFPVPGGLVKVPAAWLIDRAGWKGYRDEATHVGVHPKQALVVVNLGGATAQGVLELGGRIIEDVRAKFGVAIEMEVNVV